MDFFLCSALGGDLARLLRECDRSRSRPPGDFERLRRLSWTVSILVKVKARLEVVVAGWMLSQSFPEGGVRCPREREICVWAQADLLSVPYGWGWLILSACWYALQAEMIGFFE